jgi:hypothetical protein
VDVGSLRRRVLILANRESQAKETLAPLEAAAKELGREVEELKLAADVAKGVHDGVKAEMDRKKSLGLFAGTVGERLRLIRLNRDLSTARSNFEAATAAATAKRLERAEANKKVAAQKEVTKNLKADWKEAKKVLDSFTVKGARGSICCVESAFGDARVGAASRFLGQLKGSSRAMTRQLKTSLTVNQDYSPKSTESFIPWQQGRKGKTKIGASTTPRAALGSAQSSGSGPRDARGLSEGDTEAFVRTFLESLKVIMHVPAIRAKIEKSPDPPRFRHRFSFSVAIVLREA